MSGESKRSEPSAVLTRRLLPAMVERILGYSHADLTGRAGYAVVHPDDVEGVRAALAELLASAARASCAACVC